MSKRANGEGSIRKHKASGKWLVTFPTGLYKENGKREHSAVCAIYEYTSFFSCEWKGHVVTYNKGKTKGA